MREQPSLLETSKNIWLVFSSDTPSLLHTIIVQTEGQKRLYVDQVKEILKKAGWKGLQKGLLSLNSTVKQNMTGSSMDLFLGRPTKSLLPRSRARRVSQEELRNQRLAIQQRMMDKKRNSQTEVFGEGQEVMVQDPISRKWDKRGIVESEVVNNNGSVTSFMIRCGNRTYHRNARHLQRVISPRTPAAS